MFSSAGGFRFIQAGGLNSGLYIITGTSELAQGYIDSFGNTFFTGTSSTTSNANIITAQLSVNDTFISQRSLSGSSTNESPENMILDGTGNVYIVAGTNANTVGSNDMYIAKYDSTATLSWQKTIGTSTNDRFYDLTLAGGNLIVTGTANGGGANTYSYIAKMNSSNGAIISQITIGGTDSAPLITTDNQGNIYFTVDEITSGSNDGFVMQKMDSNLGNIFVRRGSNSSYDVFGGPVAVDSNRNIYVAGYKTSGGPQMYLMKLNSSGTLQWEKTFNFAYDNGIKSICVDSNNNVYVGGTLGAGTGPNPYVLGCIKLDTSGNIVWQRGLNGYGGTENTYLNNITCSNGKLLITGYAYYAGTKYGLVLSVSDTGGTPGTLANGFVWGLGPFTISSSTDISIATHVDNQSSASLSAVAGTLTDSTASLGQIVIGGI